MKSTKVFKKETQEDWKGDRKRRAKNGNRKAG